MTSDVDRDFWSWAIVCYETEEVRDYLLGLQEQHGLVILEAMFLAWLGGRGNLLTAEAWSVLRERISPWVDSVVLPLRQQRVVWGQNPQRLEDRRALLRLELEAEKTLAQILCGAVDVDALRREGECIARNLSHLPELASTDLINRLETLLGR